jgi:hypothetical protein
MRRKLVIATLALVLLGASTWHWAISEYFGRVDLERWEREHPCPPEPQQELGRHVVKVKSTERMVPSAGLPPEARIRQGNNNLDVIRHTDGRVYLAWRTAPSHFAGKQTAVNVVSSTDEKSWRFETRFETGRDLREPRFLSLGSRLFLYLAKLGDDPFDFEPEGIAVSERRDGRFLPLESVYKPGFIVWRARRIGEQAVLIVYGGGAGLYSYGDNPLSIELITTEDGRNFEPFNAARPVVARGGGSEADFALGHDGSLYGVIRNEAGDATGWGAKLCRAPAHDLSLWTCRPDRKKYDSPLVFEHDGEIYVIGRRNRTADGLYDVGSGPRAKRTLQNELSYIKEGKRCALFRWISGEDRLGFVLDLPSRGDTCFPSLLVGNVPNELVVYDYSSDISGPDLSWAAGQRRPTYIYRHVLEFVLQKED